VSKAVAPAAAAAAASPKKKKSAKPAAAASSAAAASPPKPKKKQFTSHPDASASYQPTSSDEDEEEAEFEPLVARTEEVQRAKQAAALSDIKEQRQAELEEDMEACCVCGGEFAEDAVDEHGNEQNDEMSVDMLERHVCCSRGCSPPSPLSLTLCRFFVFVCILQGWLRRSVPTLLPSIMLRH
jgi:hypothetical protein